MKGLFYLAIIILLFSFKFAAAEVTVPFTVDEKERVTFGDTTIVGEYEGLENYNHSYVGGFLRITFSLTHHQCCTAAYPPTLYITDRNPQATTTQIVRQYGQLYPLHTQPTHLTDVYFYDIQFDSSGYRVIVTASSTEVANMHHEDPASPLIATGDYAALVNHYPKQNPINTSSMSFEPLPIYEAIASTPAATTTPVIIVPGIMGTKLLEDGNLIWPDFVSLALSNSDDFLDDLKMDENGEALNSSIVSGDIMRNVSSSDYWEGLINNLNSTEFQENTDIFVFPYDWRLDLVTTSVKLKNKIDELKTQKGVDKVNLIAHSMGGLLVKNYLKDFGGDSVSKFIDIGSPHTGSPSAFKILSFGDNLGVSYLFGIFNINRSEIKEISQNMPAVYQLLPSEEYFDESDPNYRYYVFNGVNGNNRLSHEETMEYMKSEGRNGLLVDRAKAFHEEIGGLNPADYGVETYNFVGCGTPTIGQFYILGKEGDKYIYNIKMINGDGTVPLKSAEALSANQTYYVRNAQHAVMPSTSGVKDLIAEILTATSSESFDISPYSNLASSSDNCQIPNGKIVSFHSPIELHVHDSSGNHAGPDDNGDMENNISGVVYEVIDDNKFAFLPDGLEYTISGGAIDAGTFDVRIQELVAGEVATTTVYADIPLTLTTQTQFSIGSNLPAQISLDHDNDSIFEASQGISTTTAGILESTGKIAVVVAVSDTPTSISSRAQFTRAPEVVVEGATSTESEIVAPPLPQVLPPAVIERQDGVENKAPVIESEANYKNTAVAYKSFGYKVGELFKSIWARVKSWWR